MCPKHHIMWVVGGGGGEGDACTLMLGQSSAQLRKDAASPDRVKGFLLEHRSFS